jgi:hypothetical protein
MIPKNPESFRRNIQKKLSEKIGGDDTGSIGLNLEKGIYNRTLLRAGEMNIVKKWDNEYFVQLYVDWLKCICINLENEDVMNMIKVKKSKHMNLHL